MTFLRQALFAAIDSQVVPRYGRAETPTLTGLPADYVAAAQLRADQCETLGDLARSQRWRMETALVYHWVGAISAAHQAWAPNDTVVEALQPLYQSWACYFGALQQEIDGKITRMQADSLIMACPTWLDTTRQDQGQRRPQPTTQQAMLWRVYPNPTEGSLLLQVDLPEAAQLSLSLTNPMGQTVHTRKPWSAQAGTSLERLDLRQLPAGIYVLRLSVEGETYSQKIWRK